jgi:hypothetical protein
MVSVDCLDAVEEMFAIGWQATGFGTMMFHQ